MGVDWGSFTFSSFRKAMRIRAFVVCYSFRAASFGNMLESEGQPFLLRPLTVFLGLPVGPKLR